MIGKVYLVGAGPGDPELITVKGLKAIQNADVILYDRLVNRELLRYAKNGAKRIFCGKFPHHHTMKQESIQNLLVKYAKSGQQVVRLKGGDPFVFGRGGEEALACVKNGIPFEVVPGISAGIAAPAYAGIPVTHRNMSKSFAFITAYQSGNQEADQNWSHLANGIDTLCIYMGVSQLPNIVRKLTAHGKPLETPIALIQWGTCTNQKTVVATLKTIVDKVKMEGMTNPSMIIIGEVVRLHKELDWFQKEFIPTLSVADSL